MSSFARSDLPALWAAALAATVTVVVLQGLLRSPVARRILDVPNHRSLHAAPTPRIGGLGILCGLAFAAALFETGLPIGVWAALALLGTVSLADDLRGLPITVRLPLHLTAAAVACVSIAPDLGAAWLVLATVCVGWSINLYNFMDGLDGLAGSQAVFGFGALALAALAAGEPGLAAACAATAGAAAGFLALNLPPARLFMGDSGSTSLGLLAGAFGLLGIERGAWPVWFPVAAFLPFVLDASFTVALRAVRGQRFWQAHREHAYQRLGLGPLGRRRALGTYALLMALSAGVALAGLSAPDRAPAPAVLAAVLAGLYAAACRSRPADTGASPSERAR